MVILACLALLSTGCLSGIPVRRMPPEFLGMPRADMQEISLGRLRQNAPEVYVLGPGDVLGIWVETIMGKEEDSPPVHFPEDKSQPPSIGFPIPIGEDGRIVLPLVKPVPVAGLSVEDARKAILKAYLEPKRLLPLDREPNIIVTLLRKRQYKVLVVREEAGGTFGVLKRGAGFAVDLPAYENDLLHALNATGGLPGVDAENEVIIYRGKFEDAAARDRMIAELNLCRDVCDDKPLPPDDRSIVRIPLRFYPENLPQFTEADITLWTGDIVLIRSREREKFYTGGVLRGGEFQLPRDYDLDILGAIALAGGPIGSGGSGVGRTTGGGNFAGSNIGLPPSVGIVLRKLPGNRQVAIRVDLNKALKDPTQRILIQPEDVVIVRYTFPEELANAAMSVVSFNFLFNGFSGQGIR
jgi:protein involved in polysaccharide export with SLBB domain